MSKKSSGTAKTPPLKMFEFRVVKIPPTPGTTDERAQIKSNSTAMGAQPLDKFTHVKDKLAGLPVGSYVPCKPTTNASPVPGELEPAGEAIQPQQTAGARSSAQGPGQSLFDDNPYNFAAFDGTAPWGVDEAGHGDATHERWHVGRRSGRLEVTYAARTPVFVPSGSLDRERESGAAQEFWQCRHPDDEPDDMKGRFGIPGSSMKGVIRTLFETLTNSRVGFVSEDAYDAIPYRRRTATAWVVVGDHPKGGKELARCQVKFVKRTDATWFERGKNGLEPWVPDAEVAIITDPTIDPAKKTIWQALPYRANLWWSPNHSHKYSHLALKVGPSTAHLIQDDVDRFERGLSHSAYDDHPDMVQRGPGKNYYRSLTAERGSWPNPRRAEMANLSPGSVVFGLAENGKMLSIGRNANYLWPSAKSPRELIGDKLWPRAEGQLHLKGADLSEATFGFAGRHTPTSHPFRSRVRFTTFWASAGVEMLPAVPLAPLVSPTGTKLKARPLYLPAGKQGITQTYDEAQSMRGRKFYWHQRWTQGSIPTPHSRAGWRAREMEYLCAEAVAAHKNPESVQAPAETELASIRPLSTGTTFSGQVHFENLTLEELGALVVSLDPARFFAAGGAFGIKVGKAKPMGLGSLQATHLALFLHRPVEGYRDITVPVLEEAPHLIEDSVSKYRAWLARPAHAGTRPAEFIKDIEKLLRLPADGAEVVKTYVRDPRKYGWLPDFDQAQGEPKTPGRPKAMPRARDL